MARIITLGELMLRLSTPGSQRLVQAVSFEANYGGAEANVAASLAQLGHSAAFLTKLPQNPLGDAALSSLRKIGVDCAHILRGGERLGLYFLEQGASVRPPRVVYDRKGSAFAAALPEEFDFDRILEGADLLHVSGITPVLGEHSAKITKKALECAKSKGVTVSFDLNYRAKLWSDSIPEKQAMMAELMQYVDFCFGNARDAAKCLGYTRAGVDFINGDYAVCVEEEEMRAVLDTYGFSCLVTTLRDSVSASDHVWSAAALDRAGMYRGRPYRLHLVDRVGSGDAFAAGFLHGLLTGQSTAEALDFAIAAAAIKHTIPGDFNFIDEEEVLSLIRSCGDARVQR